MPHTHPNTGLRLPRQTLDAIHAMLNDKETRTDFMKEAINREIDRRYQLQQSQSPKITLTNLTVQRAIDAGVAPEQAYKRVKEVFALLDKPF